MGRRRGTAVVEQERDAGTTGYKPVLDVVVETEGEPRRLYVESKCLEYLRVKTTDFSKQFVAQARELLDDRAVSEYEHNFNSSDRYERVDARQLLKHFLAAKRVAKRERCIVRLLYVYWEPTDARKHRVFAQHASEARALCAALPDDQVQLVAMPYRDLWNGWERSGEAWITRHVTALRKRYDVPLT